MSQSALKTFQVEELKREVVNELSMDQHWRVCEPKVKKFRKVKVLVRVHFQRK